jgi:hypothetical protein
VKLTDDSSASARVIGWVPMTGEIAFVPQPDEPVAPPAPHGKDTGAVLASGAATT